MPFRVSIPESQQDRELARKLRGELPGILNWALDGLIRLRQQGHFTESKVGLEALKEISPGVEPCPDVPQRLLRPGTRRRVPGG